MSESGQDNVRLPIRGMATPSPITPAAQERLLRLHEEETASILQSTDEGESDDDDGDVDDLGDDPAGDGDARNDSGFERVPWSKPGVVKIYMQWLISARRSGEILISSKLPGAKAQIWEAGAKQLRLQNPTLPLSGPKMHNAFKKYKGLFRKFQWWRVKLSGGGWAWRSGSTYDESTHRVESSESNWKTFLGKFGKPVLCIKRHGFPHYYLQEEAFGKLEATGTDMLTIDDVLDDEEHANEAGDIIDLSDLSEESELIVDMTNNDVTDDVSFAAVITVLSGLTICQGPRLGYPVKDYQYSQAPYLNAGAHRCHICAAHKEGQDKLIDGNRPR
jgi:hypothetical protein